MRKPARSENNPSAIRKTSLNLTSDTVAVLKHLASATGSSMTDVIRRAIVLEKLVHETTIAGGRILIEQPGKSVKEIIVR